jgi:hypothetical protein
MSNSSLFVEKVNTLPQTFSPSTLYLVPSSSDANLFDLYISSKTGSNVVRIITKSDILTIINDIVNAANTGINASVSSAANSASQASISATNAINAQAASWTNGKIFNNTTSGLDGTTSGGYFSIPSTVSGGFLDLYLNNSGVAVYQNTYPAMSYLSSFIDQNYSIDQTYSWVVFDPITKRILMGLTPDGKLKTQFNWGLHSPPA